GGRRGALLRPGSDGGVSGAGHRPARRRPKRRRLAAARILSHRAPAGAPGAGHRSRARVGPRAGRIRCDAGVRRQPPRQHPDASPGDLHRVGSRSGRCSVHGVAAGDRGLQPARALAGTTRPPHDRRRPRESLVTTLAVDVKASLDGFTLDVAMRASGPTAVIGPNGAGKTTLLLLVLGILRPSAGRIALGERILFDVSRGRDVPTELRRLGYVPQSYGLFPHMNVLDNVAFAVCDLGRGGKAAR